MSQSNPVPPTQSDTSADPGPAAVAFSAVSGVLGGFCITIFVLALTLTPNGSPVTRRIDWLAATFMLAAIVYITSAGYLANAQNTLVHARPVRRGVFGFGILLFHVGNLLLSIGFILIAYPLRITFVVSIIVCIFASCVAVINFRGCTAMARITKPCSGRAISLSLMQGLIVAAVRARR